MYNYIYLSVGISVIASIIGDVCSSGSLTATWLLVVILTLEQGDTHICTPHAHTHMHTCTHTQTTCKMTVLHHVPYHTTSCTIPYYIMYRTILHHVPYRTTSCTVPYYIMYRTILHHVERVGSDSTHVHMYLILFCCTSHMYACNAADLIYIAYQPSYLHVHAL